MRSLELDANTIGVKGKDGKILPGKVLNPKGRPKGARSRLSEDFLKAVHEDWKKHGADALQKARIKDPVAYIKTVAGLIPREIKEEKTMNINFIEALKQINQQEVIDIEVQDVRRFGARTKLGRSADADGGGSEGDQGNDD